jgi:ketosteroid isomerase-like protein
MPFTGSIEDRHLIRERYSAYSDSMFSADLEGWLSHFADDVVWRFGANTMNGRDELRASWPNLWEPLKGMGLFTEVAAIEVEGDRAKGKCYSRQIFFRKDGSVTKVVGLYRDVLVRRGDAWLFAERAFEVIGSEPEGAVTTPAES